jgi:hypothetical protein
MKLNINDKYRIDSDDLNFMLYKYEKIINKIKKTERMDWNFIGFYPKIEVALFKVLQEDIRDLQETTLERVLEQIKSSEKAILKSVKAYKLNEDRVKEKKGKEEDEEEDNDEE